MFRGRKEETDELERRYASGRKQFGVIHGRRRIGKTELVTSFIKGKPAVYFQALKSTSHDNLRAFSRALNRVTGSPGDITYPSWETAFEIMEEHFEGERHLLVIDEYPFIVSQYPGFSSLLEAFYDQAGDGLFLVLLGSDVSFLKNEIRDRNSPLYKRRTFEMELGKLTFDEANLFLEGMNAEDKTSYLSLMSSYPFYLDAVDIGLSFDENVRELLFNRYGTFFDLPDQMLSDSVNVQNVYNGILSAISHRHRTLKDISEYIGEEDSKVSKYIAMLVNSEIVEKRETFMGTRRTHYFEISDPMLRFWYEFVFDRQTDIAQNGDLVFEKAKGKIEEFVCRGFEDVAALYLENLNRCGELGDLFPPIKRFRADKTALGRSVEIDGLAQTDDKLLVIECKYRKERFSNPMMEHLRESASIFSPKWERQYYVFSKSGFEENFETAPDIHPVTLDDMFSRS